MRGRLPFCQDIAGAGGSAGVLTRFLPVGAASLEMQSWLSPLVLIAIAGVGGGILAGGGPAGIAGAGAVGLLVTAGVLSVVTLSGRINDRRVVVPGLVGVGLCGAGLDWLADGQGYVVGYMALVGLALRTSRRVALLAGSPIVAAVAAEEAYDSTVPAATSLAVLSAYGFLFVISEFAAVSLGARQQAEALLAQLEAARLTAITSAAGAGLVGQLAYAHKLTCIGVLDARRALAILRQDDPPGPDSLPGLVCETGAALGIPIALEIDGVPGTLDSEAGLMVYRVVQEALTNVAKHAGRGARVTVRLAWASGGVEVSVVDRGGDGVDAGLPSGGFGLTSMAERAALKGGRLRAGHSDGGFAVRLWLPARLPAPR